MSKSPLVRVDCRHYVMQSVSRPGAAVSDTPRTERVERIERCRVGANQPLPFACPEDCLFYEPRSTSSAGWRVDRP